MPKLRPKIGNHEQLNQDTALRLLLTKVLRSCPKSRDEICDEISARLNQHITIHMLNDWTSEAKKPARFPASLVEAFCEVTGNDAVQRYLLGVRLRELLGLGERTAEWAWALRKVRQELANLDDQGQKRSRKTRGRTA